MAINKKLIHFKNKQNFENEVANNNILDNSIVFIQDSKEISTHGTLYKTVNWSILEPKVVTVESNPELQAVLYSAGLVANENYSTEEEVAAITNELFSSINKTSLVTFDEFKYFTNVTNLKTGAFSNCRSLTVITIPESVMNIRQSAFYGCSNLTTITIPENSQLTSIGSSAFSNCSNLTSITIPEGVTSFGANTFAGCNKLASITCKAITPPVVYSSTFNEVDRSIPLYIPAGSVGTYKTAEYWSEFTNIQPISE